MNERVLIVDDEEDARAVIGLILKSGGYQVEEAGNGREALRKVEEFDPNLVLLDVVMPGMSGIDVLSSLATSRPALPVVMVSGRGTIQDAVRATQIGALDFLEKPVERDRLLIAVRNAVDRDQLRREVALLREDALQKYRMIGSSDAICKVFHQIDEVAGTRATVLITGENGTGKDLVARAIHAKSDRRNGPFVKLNCAAIPETLIESELFGHEKGAFTGALAQKRGKLELADKGTLFLDEVGDLSPGSQAKLLRMLQEQVFERVGGTREIKVDARILSATNRDLVKEIEARRFREDLYYRLNVIHVNVPALQERLSDIPALAEWFLERQCAENGVPRKRFSARALEFLQGQSWPGNVRELENLVQRCAIMVKTASITPRDLTELREPASPTARSAGRTLRVARDNLERRLIRETLAACNGDKAKAARLLGIERAHLYRKVRDLGIRS